MIKLPKLLSISFIFFLSFILVHLIHCKYNKAQDIKLKAIKGKIKKEETQISPIQKNISLLTEKQNEYLRLKKNGGFPQIILPKESLKIGKIDSSLVNLKKYLFISKDSPKLSKTVLYNDTLQWALKQFQKRMGLTENGSLDKPTVTELNIPISYRLKQIEINIQRLKSVKDSIESNYIIVNIPDFKLLLFEKNKLVWTSNVVVGKEATKTIIFKGNISKIVLNPYWNVPSSILTKEIIPKMRRNKNYLSRNNMEIVSRNPLKIRQKPGEKNSLGKMKFLFPNDYNIYLHDTPSKKMFKENKRAFSHGCIRLENPKKLALLLLKNNKTWTSSKIDSVLLKQKEIFIDVSPEIPVYIIYFTSWVDYFGKLNFRKDVYGYDEKWMK